MSLSQTQRIARCDFAHEEFGAYGGLLELVSIHAVERKAAQWCVIYDALVLKNVQPDGTSERDCIEKLRDLRTRQPRH